jgi:hypothetical protein
MFHTTWRRDSRKKISYIERIKCQQGVETTTTSFHSLMIGGICHFFSSSLLHYEAHPHLSKSNYAQRMEEGWLNA